MIEGRYGRVIQEWKETLPEWLLKEPAVVGYFIEAWRDGHIHFVIKENKNG